MPQQRHDIGPVLPEEKAFIGKVAVHLADGLGIVNDQRFRRIIAIQGAEESAKIKGLYLLCGFFCSHGIVAFHILCPFKLTFDLLRSQGVKGEGIVKVLLLLRLGERRKGEDLSGHILPGGKQALSGRMIFCIIAGVRENDIRAHDDDGML